MKYTIFIILGIILFLLWNSINGFIVGLPFCIRDPSDPTTPLVGDLGIIENINPNILRRRIRNIKRALEIIHWQQRLGLDDLDQTRMDRVNARIQKLMREQEFQAAEDRVRTGTSNENLTPPLNMGWDNPLTIVECDVGGVVQCDNLPTGGATGIADIDAAVAGGAAPPATAAATDTAGTCTIDPECNVPTLTTSGSGCITWGTTPSITWGVDQTRDIPASSRAGELMDKYISHFNSLTTSDILALIQMNQNPAHYVELSQEHLTELRERAGWIRLQYNAFNNAFNRNDGTPLNERLEALNNNEIRALLDTRHIPNPHLIGRFGLAQGITDDEYEALAQLLEQRQQRQRDARACAADFLSRKRRRRGSDPG
jgi:hypothetical protein